MEPNVVRTIRNNWPALVYLGAAGFLALFVCVRLGGSLVDSAHARRMLASALAQNGKDANESKPALDAAQNTANALKKKNLFVKEAPKEHPIKQVDGILGNEAFIQNKWYKVGDKVGQAKIVSITATAVVAEWEGKKTTFSPLMAGAPAPSGPPKPPESAKAGEGEPNKPAKKADANEVKVAASQEEDPFAFMGATLSPKLRAMLLEKWNSMTDEQKEKAKQQWSQMSDEQKQQAVKALESMDRLPDM
jgi:hypothetical protein